MALPWTIGGGGAVLAQRRRLLEASLARCRFGQFAWFAALAATLERFWEQALHNSALPRFEPLSEAAAMVLGLVLGGEDGSDAGGGTGGEAGTPGCDTATAGREPATEAVR